jgi:hypothetical protein
MYDMILQNMLGNLFNRFAQACVKSAPRASQKIILGTKFSLTRKLSNFTVFGTFFYSEMCESRK